VLAVTLAVIALAACDDGQPPAEEGTSEFHAAITNVEHVEPFVPDEASLIKHNDMHNRHFADGVVCGECHLSTEPLPIRTAHEICRNCHEAKPVENPVWENHCLSCHHFTPSAENAAGDPQLIMASICSGCHRPEDTGGHLYAGCAYTGVDMESTVVCTRCHRPHETSDPVPRDVCIECHAEFANVMHLSSVETDCSLCHRPHRAQEPGEELCAACHGQAEDVLVHTIQQHPTDCLACHNAHFATIEIKNVCQDCHENLVYRAAPNQPAQHLDCHSCHHLEDFSYLGNQACVGCHQAEGAGLGNADIAAEHKRCTACHPPHTWNVPTQLACEECHEVSPIFEHKLAYHPDNCTACHNPHQPTGTPASGNCSGCHIDDVVPAFGTGAPKPHMICGNCHSTVEISSSEFEFVGAYDSCILCHRLAIENPPVTWSQVPEGHDYCVGCHTAHTWRVAPVTQSCWACHDQDDGQPNTAHAACFNCHEMDHSLRYVGAANSCVLCHRSLSDTHPDTEGEDECAACHNPHE